MKNIKNRILSSILILSAISFSSCVDKFAVGDAFLEKQPGVDVTLDTIFSNSEYARMYLWDAGSVPWSFRLAYNGMGKHDRGSQRRMSLRSRMEQYG